MGLATMTASMNMKKNSFADKAISIMHFSLVTPSRSFPSVACIITAFSILTGLANAAVLPSLSNSEYADTEVSTNVTMTAWSENTRQFTVILQFDATPSNNVQVAFGTDGSTDGNLSDEEVGLTLGWDCGEWFISTDPVTNRFTAQPANSSTRKELFLCMSLGADGMPRTLELEEGNTTLAFSGLTLLPVPPAWMYSKDWNLLKVVARGTGTQNEQITVKLSNAAVILLLR